MALADYLFGRPLATDEEGEQRVGVWAGIPMLGLDALGSAAYGPEAALTLLIPLGAAGVGYIGPISTLIILLLLVVYVSYRQTISAYPHGGGYYTVARENLGTTAGLLTAAALMLDYVLVVAVGISARVGALVSAVPALQPYMLPLCLAILAGITAVNLRSVRESGMAFLVPTYLFVASMLAVLAIGVLKVVLSGGRPSPLETPPPQAGAATATGLWVLMRAFASGCTAMTGVEAVSNGVAAFREPTVAYARRTLTAIIVLLAVMLAVIAYLCRAYGIGATEPGGPATRASCRSSPPRSSAGVLSITSPSARSWASWCCRPTPASPTSPGSAASWRRTATCPTASPTGADGSSTRGAASSWPGSRPGSWSPSGDHRPPDPALRRRRVPRLHPPAGEDGRPLATRRRRALPGAMAVNALGAACTAVTLVVVLVSKFLEGAWVMVLLIPALLAFFSAVRSHYRAVARELATDAPLDALDLAPPLALLPIRGWSAITRKALRFALKISPEVYALHVADDERAMLDLEDGRRRNVQEPATAAPKLIVIYSPYRRLFGPLKQVVSELQQSHVSRDVAVIVPELVATRWYHYLLHNQTASVIKFYLLLSGFRRVVVINVPWYLAGITPSRDAHGA